MTKEEKRKFIKQSFLILEQLAVDINEHIADAKDGVQEEGINLIMGGLSGIDSPAHQIKNIYEILQYVHMRF